MAQMNEGRYENLAARALAVKGPGVLTYLEESLLAVLPMDTAAPYEFWEPQRIDRFSTRTSVSAVAGEYSGVEIRNVTDDQLYVIEDVYWRASAVAFIGFVYFGDQTTNAFATPMVAKALDSRIARFNTFVPGTLGSRVLAGVAGSEIIAERRVTSSEEAIFDLPLVVGPGYAVTLVNQVVNAGASITVNFHTRSFVP